MPIALISHSDCLLHEMGGAHPEQPARLHAINDRLIASHLGMVLHQYDAPAASREQLLMVHQPAYLDRVFTAEPEQGLTWLDGDTAMGRHSLSAALYAAGAGILGVDLVLGGEVDQAFCAVRPPGHHAGPDYAMGFCIFNNIAVAAYHAIQNHGLERIAIIDFDVHHGNGTQDIVGGDERILFCSSFQHPFYPGSGFADNPGNVINLPLPALTDGKALRQAISERWLGQIQAFAPQLILISAGFDGHQADDMAQFNLVDADYGWITSRLMDLARISAQGRIVSLLEGGYELHALARSVEAHLKAFIGEV
ncbi:MAG: histone deacetylase family protein [Gammaproteobacteria bacterium SHHR-1]|uniref:histone deacetylase family protein n=1 Tax=Magnetovirga frankeli TaxID=947516 RepID=UPI0012939084|nr:histone deacetylase family protein [gamma proteobacterium SS-5]